MGYIPTKKTTDKKSYTESFAIPNSSFLQASTFDAKNNSLTLDFKNGSQLVYNDFSASAWDQFKRTSSKGSYYSRMIKGKYSAVEFKASLKVSDLDRAIKENRPNADKHNPSARKKAH